MKEAAPWGWTTRSLERQINTLLFEVQAFKPGNAAITVRQLLLNEMDELARNCKSRGFNAFILNMTPNKASPAIVDSRDGVINRELLLKAWAANRVPAGCRAEAWRVQYVGPWQKPIVQRETKRQRTALENLRDMGAGDVPFVHWQLALLAAMLGDDQGRWRPWRYYRSLAMSFPERRASP